MLRRSNEGSRAASPSSSRFGSPTRQARSPVGEYDVALCLGASFVSGGLADTVEALEPAVKPGGHVVVGEPFWRRLPLPDDYEDRGATRGRRWRHHGDLRDVGLPVVSVIASSEDDWDRYETLHWRAVEEWLRRIPPIPTPTTSAAGASAGSASTFGSARVPRLGDLRRLEARWRILISP